jgi:hypothetical protein
MDIPERERCFLPRIHHAVSSGDHQVWRNKTARACARRSVAANIHLTNGVPGPTLIDHNDPIILANNSRPEILR